MHSFRHSMRDCLREVECPVDMINQIGGWSREGVGERYGDGYSLEKLHSYMTKLQSLVSNLVSNTYEAAL